jgi:hypothetical protein
MGSSKRRAGSKIVRKRCRDFGVPKIGISGAVFVTTGKCPLRPISALTGVCAGKPLILLDSDAPPGPTKPSHRLRGGRLDTRITQDIRFSDAGWGAAVVKFDAAATTSGGLIYDAVISGFDSPDRCRAGHGAGCELRLRAAPANSMAWLYLS